MRALGAAGPRRHIGLCYAARSGVARDPVVAREEVGDAGARLQGIERVADDDVGDFLWRQRARKRRGDPLQPCQVPGRV